MRKIDALICNAAIAQVPTLKFTMDTFQIARRAVADIAARFSTLRMVENPKDPVELSIMCPVQPGLVAVQLSTQLGADSSLWDF
jgi:hypothetical protein